MSLASLKRAQNGIPRLAKTVKEQKRFLMYHHLPIRISWLKVRKPGQLSPTSHHPRHGLQGRVSILSASTYRLLL